MPVLFANNASATLAASISSSTTTISVPSGQGGLFPAVPAGSHFFATLTDPNNNIEVVKVTARAGDAMTVVRGQEGTTAREFASSDRIEMRITAAALRAFSQPDAVETFSAQKTFTQPILGDLEGDVTGDVIGDVTGNVTGDVVGNASTATTLETARTINGTSFNGSENITTDTWGAARNITIGATTKSVNGSTNLNWTGVEIGVMPVGATYIQFPGYAAPSALFGGTWVAIFDNEGVFFRTPGGNASAFGSGIQADELKSHTHRIPVASPRGGGSGSPGVAENQYDVNRVTDPTGGVETRPRNRTIRVWARTA